MVLSKKLDQAVTDEFAIALLAVDELNVDYRLTGGQHFRAVRDVSFTVGRGELVCLVGESGSGKSTTAHTILGLLGPGAHVTGGSVRFDGQELTTLSERRWRAIRGQRIGFIPQDPTVSLNPTRRIGDQIGEAIKLHKGRQPKVVLRTQVNDLLVKVGLDRPELRARQYPHHLSGGMRQRVLVAIALANDPELIIADEPTSALDVTIQKQILDHIDQLRAEDGIAVLLITHDLGVARDRSDRLVVLSTGQVVESGGTTAVLDQPADPYTQRLVAAVPGLRSGRSIWDGESSRLQSTDDVRDADSTPILRARGLRKAFHMSGEPVHALAGVSIDVRRGGTLGVVGESGSGKSTLARVLTRLADPDGGTVEFDGHDITGIRRGELRKFRRRAQLVYQNPFSSLDPRFSVGRSIAEPLRAQGIGSREARTQRVAELLDLVQLPAEFTDRSPKSLSGGQRQRVAIARALATGPDLVVLDEAVSALDVSVQAQILDLLLRLQAELGVSYLFISHDLAVVRQISDDIVVLRHGTVMETGPAQQIYEHPTDPYTRSLLSAIPGAAANMKQLK